MRKWITNRRSRIANSRAAESLDHTVARMKPSSRDKWWQRLINQTQWPWRWRKWIPPPSFQTLQGALCQSLPSLIRFSRLPGFRQNTLTQRRRGRRNVNTAEENPSQNNKVASPLCNYFCKQKFSDFNISSTDSWRLRYTRKKDIAPFCQFVCKSLCAKRKKYNCSIRF